MDGLRLALIIAGILVVAGVYWWTARRRRIEREAGDFDRFDAWTDDSLDPLADAPRAEPSFDETESITIPNPNLAAHDDAQSPGIDDPAVLQGLEAIAESLETDRTPSLGDVSEVRTQAPAPQAGDMSPKVEDVPPQAEDVPPPRKPTPRAPSRRRKEPPQRAAPEPSTPPVEEMVVVINVMAPVGENFDGPVLRDALENAGLRAGAMNVYHYHAQAQTSESPPIFSALNVIKPGTLVPEQFEGMRTPGVALVMRLPGAERPSEAFELMYGVATHMAEELGGRLCDETRSSLTGQVLNHLRERIADLSRRQRAGS